MRGYSRKEESVEILTMENFFVAAIVLHLLILWLGVAHGLGMVCDYLAGIDDKIEQAASTNDECEKLLASIANTALNIEMQLLPDKNSDY